MKTETVKIEVQRFTDDSENPTCLGCFSNRYYCSHSESIVRLIVGIIVPSETCPIWNNIIKPKYATWEDWDREVAINFESPVDRDATELAWEAARK